MNQSRAVNSLKKKSRPWHRHTGVILSTALFFVCSTKAFGDTNTIDSHIDRSLISLVDQLRESGADVSWLGGELTKDGVASRDKVRRLPQRIPDLKSDPALQAACLMGYFIQVTAPTALVPQIEKAARSMACKCQHIAGSTYIIYPTMVENPLNREILLIDVTLQRATNSIVERLATIDYVRTARANSDAISQAWAQESALLTEFNRQITLTQAQLDLELEKTASRNQTLKDWAAKIAEVTPHIAILLKTSTPSYDPKKDPGIPILTGDPHIVPINQSKVPCRPWDGAQGVAIPYIDRDLESALERFFSEQHDALQAGGLGNLKLEGASRTPERQASLPSNDAGRASKPYDSNHLDGTAVDFSNEIDYTAHGLSPAQAAARQKSFKTLQSMLQNYGIVLGTQSHGKPDPIHATLNGFEKPNSPQRLARTVSMVARYAAGYSQLHAVALAQRSAADSKTADQQASLARATANVAAASDKCKKLQQQLGQQRNTNQELSHEISTCMQAYGALKALKDHNVATDVDGKDLEDRINRGEDVSGQVERAFDDAMHSCLERFGNVSASVSYGPDGTITSFSVSCGNQRDDDKGDNEGDSDDDKDGSVTGGGLN